MDPTITAEARAKMIRAYADLSGYRTFVETGSGYGHTTSLVMDVFDLVYTIEVDPERYQHCQTTFAGVPNIAVVCGDSEMELGRVLKTLGESAVLWLDAHYCGGERVAEKETPIWGELAVALADDRPHLILIDDARLFGTRTGYPSLEDIRECAARDPRYQPMVLRDDVMRILPIGIANPED